MNRNWKIGLWIVVLIGLLAGIQAVSAGAPCPSGDRAEVQLYWSYYQRSLPVNCEAAEPADRAAYWSHYQNPPTSAFADLTAGQPYWAHYQNPPSATARVERSNEQAYWFHYQNPPASTAGFETVTR